MITSCDSNAAVMPASGEAARTTCTSIRSGSGSSATSSCSSASPSAKRSSFSDVRTTCSSVTRPPLARVSPSASLAARGACGPPATGTSTRAGLSGHTPRTTTTSLGALPITSSRMWPRPVPGVRSSRAFQPITSIRADSSATVSRMPCGTLRDSRVMPSIGTSYVPVSTSTLSSRSSSCRASNRRESSAICSGTATISTTLTCPLCRRAISAPIDTSSGAVSGLATGTTTG